MNMNKINYKQSGVDIDCGNDFVEGIKPYVKETFSKNVIGGIGSFAGAYELPQGYKAPVILGATDGVGTKLRLAIDYNRLNNVGIDLVAMCVNDLICNFATPLFFLDYYATGKLNKTDAIEVVKGIANGCKQSKCSLIGGETAEMPGMYHGNDFDLAGFAVGVAEKEDILNGNKIAIGDILIALPSSGIHSNGFSLVRKIIQEAKLDLEARFDSRSLIDTLLEPTKIYVQTYLNNKDKINALAHITGGGIVENLPRIFKDGMGAKIEKRALRILPIFEMLSKYVDEAEAFRVFNMGVGMVIATNKNHAQDLADKCDGYIIGEVVSGSGVKLY